MRMKKRALALALGLILSVGSAVPALAANDTPSFTDVPKEFWGYSSIEQAAEKGWIKGYPGKEFRPMEGVSYAQLSVMLTQAFFPEELAAYTGDKAAWYTPACAVADGLGLFAGTAAEGQSSVSSAVNGKMDRYELAQMVYNTIKAKGGASAVDLKAAEASTPDWSGIPEGYRPAVAAAKAAKVISGVDKAGTFDGGGAMNRAQAAVVLLKLEKAVAPAEKPAEPETPPQTSASFTVTTPEFRLVTADGFHWDPDDGGTGDIRITCPSLGLEDSLVYHSLYPFTFESSNEELVFVGRNGTIHGMADMKYPQAAKEAYVTVTNTEDGTTARVKVTLEWVPEEEIPTVDDGYIYPADDAYIEKYAAEMLRLCNASRASIGVAPLKYMENVQDCINGRAEELIQLNSHTRPNGKLGPTYFKDYGYTAHLLSGAENIASDFGVKKIGSELYMSVPADWIAREFFTAWITSPGHRSNIQSSDHACIAVGLAFNPDSAPHKNNIYSVQIFGYR